MKKERNSMVILALNSTMLALVILSKKYRPMLESFASQYTNLRKDMKRNKKQMIAYKKQLEILLEEAKSKIGDFGSLVNETLQNYSIHEIARYEPISKDVQTCICQKLEKVYDGEFVRYVVPTSHLAFAGVDSSSISVSPTELIADTEKWKNFMNANILKNLCYTMTLIIAFQSWSVTNSMTDNISLDNVIIEELEEFFSDTINYRVYAFHDHLENIESMKLEYQKIEEPMTLEQRIEWIFLSNDSYESKFDRILKFHDLTIEQAVDIIIHSNITDFTNIFEYILAMQQLKQYEKIDYIVNSNIVTYEELFHFFIVQKQFTVEQKIDYILQIPCVSFERLWTDLFTIEGASQEQIIINIIKADIVSFDTLFHKIVALDDFTKEKLTYYLKLYNASYNSIILEDMVTYVFHLDMLTKEEQIECVWELLSSYTLNDRVQFLLHYYQVTLDEYRELFIGKKTNLSEDEYTLLSFIEKVYSEKEKFILENHFFESKSQLDQTVAGCAAEGANHYIDLYGVANVIFNRITQPYYAEKGRNPYLQFIAPKQFEVYETGSYLSYLYPKDILYERKYRLAMMAFYDMFYSNYDGIMHNYLEFRSWGTTSFSNTYFVIGGNRYGVPMNPSTRIKYENLLENNEDVESHVLIKIKYPN